VSIATEGALWGAVAAHGFLQQAVIISDDARQFLTATVQGPKVRRTSEHPEATAQRPPRHRPRGGGGRLAGCCCARLPSGDDARRCATSRWRSIAPIWTAG